MRPVGSTPLIQFLEPCEAFVGCWQTWPLPLGYRSGAGRKPLVNIVLSVLMLYSQVVMVRADPSVLLSRRRRLGRMYEGRS
jgi:hypothetical protein